MSDKIFSARMFAEVQCALTKFGIQSTLSSQMHFGTILLIDPPKIVQPMPDLEWFPTLKKENITHAQRLANYARSCRLSNEETFKNEIESKLFDACKDGTTFVEVKVPIPLLTNSSGCARILGSIVNKGYFAKMFADKFKVSLPDPCIISLEEQN